MAVSLSPVYPAASGSPSTTFPVIAVTFSVSEWVGAGGHLPLELAFKSIVAAGGTPLAIDCSLPQTHITELIARADGVLLLGGIDVSPTLYGGNGADPLVEMNDPVRDSNELEALQAAEDHRRPVLAVCRGMQLLNIAHGGTLVADLRRDYAAGVEHRSSPDGLLHAQHEVTVDLKSCLAGWIGGGGLISVNSYHHQGVAALGDGILAIAHAHDGLVEAIQTEDGMSVGVQWHPELLWPRNGDASALMRGFVDACRQSSRGASGGLATCSPFS